MAKTIKLTEIQQIQLVTDISQMLLKGYKNPCIYKHAESEYKITFTQCNRYIKEAKANFLQIDKKVKGQLRAKYRARLEMMFHDAYVEKNDLALALKVQDQLNKLVNLYDEDGAENVADIKLIFKFDEDDKKPNKGK